MKLSSQALTVLTLAAVVAILAIILVYRQNTAPAAATTTDVDFQLDRQPVMGDPDAPATIISFEDFKCPICEQYERQVVPQVERELVETGEANMAFVNFQFLGPDSITAGIAGECAYQQDPDLFWDYKTAIFRAQGPENETWATRDRLVQVAREVVPDLDAEELSQCIEEERTRDEVDLDNRIAREAGATGTPTVFVNGTKLDNWQFADIEAAVERATAQSE